MGLFHRDQDGWREAYDTSDLVKEVWDLRDELLYIARHADGPIALRAQAALRRKTHAPRNTGDSG